MSIHYVGETSRLLNVKIIEDKDKNILSTITLD